MRDAVLAYDDGAVSEPSSDVVREVAVYGWYDTNQIVGDAAYAAEQVDG